MCLLHGNILCVTVGPMASPREGGFLAIVSLLHDKHSSSSSCSPASYSPDSEIEKENINPHIFYPIRRKLTF